MTLLSAVDNFVVKIACVKFKDCDLIGYPLRVTISPKTLDGGNIEVKVRRSGEFMNFGRDECVEKITDLLKTL